EYHWLDRDNLFVTGGSYRGFMVNWSVTHSSLFKAAISPRSMTNFVSLVGDSDIGYFFFKDELGLELTEFEKLWQASPIAYAKEVKTPLLLMRSEEHTSELQSRFDLVCRLLLEKKKHDRLRDLP